MQHEPSDGRHERRIYRRPPYQIAVALFVAALGAYVGFGAILDATSNAATLVTVPVTLSGTAILALIWIVAELRTRETGVLWLLGSQPVVIRKLGWSVRAGFFGVLVGLWLPRLAPAPGDECGKLYLKVELRADGFLNGYGEQRTDERYAGAKYYEFLIGNPTSRCTAVVDRVVLEVLDAAENLVGLPEATTEVYEYSVSIAPETRGPMLVTDETFNYPPQSSPEIFRVNVVPLEWGYDFAVRFQIFWHDLQTGRKYSSSTCTMIAAFPKHGLGFDRSLLAPDYFERRERRLRRWQTKYDTRGCARLPDE